MSVKNLTSILLCACLAGLYFVLPYEEWVRELTLLLAISWLIRSYSQMNHSVVRAREHMELEAASVLVQTVVFIAGALGCLWMGLPIVTIGWAAIAAAIVQLLASTAIAARFSPIRIEARPHWDTFRDATPYAAALLAYIAFAQINVVIVSLVADQKLVGEFSSVSRILLLASVFPQLVSLAIMPASSRVFGRDDMARFRRLTTASLRILLVLAGAGAVALVAVSQPLMGWIYGEALESLFPYLQVGSLYIVVQFTTGVLGIALTSAGRQGARAQAVVVALLCAVGLFAGLTAAFGVLGAVLALVLSEGVLLVAEAVPAWDLLEPRRLLANAAWVLAGGGVAVSAHFALAAAGHPVLSVAAALILYASILWLSGEPRALIALVRSRG